MGDGETFIDFQIERAGALESVAEIAAIPDVDLIFVGPSDLSQVLGCTGVCENPRCLDTIQSIPKTSAAASEFWVVFYRGPAYAERMREWGCRFLVAADPRVVHAGIRDVKACYSTFFQPR